MSPTFVSMVEAGDVLSDLVRELAEWAQATFGTDQERGPIGALKHLEKEAREAQAAPNDVTEYADCLILIIDAARRAGFKPLPLLKAAYDKLQVNKTRTYQRPYEWVYDEPHYVPDGEDCMGRPESGYWRCWAKHGDGKTVGGFGLTKQQALDDAKKRTSEEPLEHVRAVEAEE